MRGKQRTWAPWQAVQARVRSAMSSAKRGGVWALAAPAHSANAAQIRPLKNPLEVWRKVGSVAWPWEALGLGAVKF